MLTCNHIRKVRTKTLRIKCDSSGDSLCNRPAYCSFELVAVPVPNSSHRIATCVEARLFAYEIDGAAGCIFTEKCSLRTSQNLDSFQVVELVAEKRAGRAIDVIRIQSDW